MEIHKYEIESVMILFSCLNITYLNKLIPSLSNIFFITRLVLIIYILCNMFLSKRHFSKTMNLIGLFVIWIIVISIVRDVSIVTALRNLSIPVLFSMYVDYNRHSKNVYKILGVWSKFLFILVFIDFITELLYPTGMYQDSIYMSNWFLGYKTARLVYSLPLCVFQAIYSLWKYGKLTWKSYICFIMSVYTLFFSKATSASVTLTITCVVIAVICLKKKDDKIGLFWKYFANFKVVIPIYAVISFLTVYVQDSPFIQYFIVNIFQKDATLTTRTTIWKNCIEVFNMHPLTGNGYLSIEQYQYMTNNIYATSAHNMILSILVSGGIIAMLIYIFFMISAWNSLKRKSIVYKQISSMGVIAILIIGMTSSSVLFSLSGFVFFVLMEINMQLDEME